MSALTLTDTLNDARARWLRGEAQAWPRYAECCLALEAELRKRSADHTDKTSSPESEAPPSAPSR